MTSLFTTDMKFTQDNRFMRVESALGKDVFLLRKLQATEAFSQLFSIDVDLLSYDGNIRAENIVGTHIATFIGTNSLQPRPLNGFVKSFAYTGLEKRGLYGYKAELVPWLWFLDKRTNCRIFQNQTLQQIIEAVFGELGFSDFNFSLIETHLPFEYCVQYQESDFHFISRMLEQEGLFYFFEHKADKHILHIADNSAAFVFLDEKVIEHSSGSRTKDFINAWQHRFQYCSGAFAQTDYNFENANLSLLTETPTSIKLSNNSALERFEFPGNYTESQRGQNLTRIRMQQEEAGYQAVSAASDLHLLEVGKKFKLRSDEAAADDKKNFVVAEIRHEAFEGSYLDESNKAEAGGESRYQNYFVCIPEEVTYRPPLRTTKPRIDGVQTAMVVGKPGDEIYTDKYGRIKLQFYWDRYGKKNETSSCWVRVATLWAGTKWGTLNIPRVGQEVVVTFVNGDPDQPLVIGSVYNSTHMPPVGLPEGKNYAGMKSRSVKAGAGSFNEFSLDDSNGSEQVKLHAQKDYNTTVGNNLTSSVTADASYNVDGNSSSTIGGNSSLAVQGNESASVQGNQDYSVQGNRSGTVAGNLTENTSGKAEASVGASDSRNVGTNQDITIGANQTLTVGANQTISVSANQETTVSGNQSIGVTGKQDISALAQNVSISTSAKTSATTVSIDGSASISLSVGGANITLDPASITLSMGASSVKIDAMGVTVVGPMVKLN
ncbi:MAG TPA: type VI secretion system tip protein TssI/VgrG [Cellvibrio sp.]|nr:type VI secretion system tip protein TssI/VgrG [Cellvibrio sp.]